MFIQVIKAKVRDQEALRAATDRWADDLGPGAVGWLGTTAGVTDDGTFLAAARFESQEAAHANSERPEQGAWWQDVEQALDGAATFHDCPHVFTMRGGGSDQAGFVQVMQSAAAGTQQMLGREGEMEAAMAGYRPELLGVLGASDGETLTQVAYFTSEAEARKGEQEPPPPKMQEMFGELEQMMGPTTYYDLRDPWLRSRA